MAAEWFDDLPLQWERTETREATELLAEACRTNTGLLRLAERAGLDIAALDQQLPIAVLARQVISSARGANKLRALFQLLDDPGQVAYAERLGTLIGGDRPPTLPPSQSGTSVRVFISYAWEDEDYKRLVKQLAARLCSDGVNARLDSWHAMGVPFPHFMNNELREADRVLVVCSPKYRQNVHATEAGARMTGVGWETMLLTAALFTPGGASWEKLVVVVLSGTRSEAIPDFLQAVPSFDLSNRSTFETEYRRLLRRLLGREERPPWIGTPPADIDPEPVTPLTGTPRTAAPRTPQPERSGEQAERPNLPIVRLPPRNLAFKGRSVALEKLGIALATTGAAAITGLGGVGKSQVALEYAHRHRHEYALVWRVHAEESDVLMSDLARVAVELNPRLATLDLFDQMSAAQRELDQLSKPWLLLFDNAESEEKLRPLFPNCAGGQVIITSRNPNWRTLAEPLGLDEMSEEEALEVLDRGRTGDARMLASELGYLPLALAQATSYMEATQIPIREYLELLKENERELLTKGNLSDYSRTAATTWIMSVTKVQSESTVAALLLDHCSFLAPDGIPLELFVPAVTNNRMRLNDAIGLLRRYSLVERVDDALSVHRLVQAAVRDGLGGRQEEVAMAAMEAVATAFTVESADVSRSPVLERLVPHALAVLGHVRRGGWVTDKASTLLEKLVSYFHQNYPVSIQALCVLVARSSCPPHYKIALVMRDNPKHDRFIIDASGMPRRGWDDSADLRIITDDKSLTAFLRGEINPSDPNHCFIWTGRDEALQQLAQGFRHGE